MTKRNKRLSRAAHRPSASTVGPCEHQSDELLLETFLKDFDFKTGDINAVREGLHPIHYAVQTNNRKVVEILLNKGVKVDCIGIRNHSFELIKNHFLEFKFNTGYDARQFDLLTPLHAAVEMGYDEIVKLLLDRGADVNIEIKSSSKIEFQTALSRAAQYGHENIVNLLLAAGAKISKRDESAAFALMQAVRNNHAKIVEILIKKIE